MRALAVSVLVCLVGCGGDPSAARHVQLLPVGGLAGRADYEALGRVRGRLCQVSTFQALPTESDARRELQLQAARRGADGVVAVDCRGLSIFDGCVGIECAGEAFRWKRPPSAKTF